jgi:hypothetical protein
MMCFIVRPNDRSGRGYRDEPDIARADKPDIACADERADEPDIARAATPRTQGTFAAGQSRLGVYEAMIGAPVGSFASAPGPPSQASE